MKLIFQKIGFFTAFIIPVLVIGGFTLGGYWNGLAIIFSFVLMPLADQLVGTDPSNIPTAEAKIRAEEYFYRFITYCWTWFQVIFLFWGAFAVASGELNSAWEYAAFILSFSLVTGGIGITVAHELGHKKSAIERIYSKILLMTVCYMHFYIEHNRGHHVHVATPLDPATARRGENFYSFWIRSVVGSYRHAWALEKERLEKKNRRLLSVQNEMIWFTILPILFCAILTIATSMYMNRTAWEVPAFFFAQSIIAFSLLEAINYVEHYGIERRELSPGKFERVNPLHSWNASHLISNFFLFQLQRHSDHHAFAHKRYQVLNHYDESPQLPFGYPTMLMMALVPPLWFAVMDKRLERWKNQAEQVLVTM